jgi:hypothetical protein
MELELVEEIILIVMFGSVCISLIHAGKIDVIVISIAL